LNSSISQIRSHNFHIPNSPATACESNTDIRAALVGRGSQAAIPAQKVNGAAIRAGNPRAASPQLAAPLLAGRENKFSGR